MSVREHCLNLVRVSLQGHRHALLYYLGVAVSRVLTSARPAINDVLRIDNDNIIFVVFQLKWL